MKNKQKLVSFPMIFFTLFLSLTGQACAEDRFTPGISYYFDNFDPAQTPWKPGNDLNYEEVFKNYLFYEIVFSPSGKEMTINRYLRNNKMDSKQYSLNPDGSLSRKPDGS